MLDVKNLLSRFFESLNGGSIESSKGQKMITPIYDKGDLIIDARGNPIGAIADGMNHELHGIIYEIAKEGDNTKKTTILKEHQITPLARKISQIKEKELEDANLKIS